MKKKYLINTIIVVLALFFCFRELGTFPNAWLDDSLFMVAAQSLVHGNGYGLPIMGEHWNFPFILAVGPTVIAPSAFTMMLLGETVAIARIPAVLYTLACIYTVYIFAKQRAGIANAQMAALLIVTLSAFINNGKPLLGEVPSIFFLFVGLLLLHQASTHRTAAIAGCTLGVAIVTKLTLGLILPALACAIGLRALQKNTPETYRLITIIVSAFCIFLLWQLVEIHSNPGGIQEVYKYGLASGGSQFLQILRSNPFYLLRFQFVYFGIMLFTGMYGIYTTRNTLRNGTAPFLVILILLFCLYFVNGPGWYRHLITAHILLIPFVPVGIWALLGKRMGTLLLVFFIIAQGWWQLTYHGSTKSFEAELATVAVRDLPYEQMVIEQPEVYFRLPTSEKYLFVSREYFREYLQFDLPLTQEEHCLPVVRKIGPTEREGYGSRLKALNGRFVLILPKTPCNT